jgi:hypothetical protein
MVYNTDSVDGSDVDENTAESIRIINLELDSSSIYN